MSLYLTSTDPEVIAVVERNAEGRRTFVDRALAWAQERGADSFFPSSFGGRLTVRGLPIVPVGFGRWTKPNHRGCSWPYSNNKAEEGIRADLAFKAEPVPGIPSTVHATGDGGTSYLMWPTPFVQDGAAWICYSHTPDKNDAEKFGEQWTECLASQWHAAHEAYTGKQVAS